MFKTTIQILMCLGCGLIIVQVYRYIRENVTDYLNRNEWKAGNASFNYANLTDKEAEATTLLQQTITLQPQ